MKVRMTSTKQQNFGEDSAIWICELQMKWNWYDARYASRKCISTIATKIAFRYDQSIVSDL